MIDCAATWSCAGYQNGDLRGVTVNHPRSAAHRPRLISIDLARCYFRLRRARARGADRGSRPRVELAIDTGRFRHNCSTLRV